MTDKRILYVTQAISPYLPSTPISDYGRNLPQAIHSKGAEVRIFTPKFGQINERRNQLHEVIRLSGLNIIIDDNDHPLILKVASMQPSRIQVYFIDNEDYFQKSAADEDAFGSNRSDNDERAIFFARGTAETVRKLRWDAGVVHCSGLMTSLVPLYMRQLSAADPSFKTGKVIYSVIPGEFTGGVDARITEKLKMDDISEDAFSAFTDHPVDTKLLHLLAIGNADGVIFHSETPDPDLLKYIEEHKIPYILAPEDSKDAQAYIDFYDTLPSNE